MMDAWVTSKKVTRDGNGLGPWWVRPCEWVPSIPVCGWRLVGIDLTKVEMRRDLRFEGCEFHHCIIPDWLNASSMDNNFFYNCVTEHENV